MFLAQFHLMDRGLNALVAEAFFLDLLEHGPYAFLYKLRISVLHALQTNGQGRNAVEIESSVSKEEDHCQLYRVELS